MKHAKSNANVFKKNSNENKRKGNIVMKSLGNSNFNTIKASNLGRKKNYLISLLGKKNTKNLNLNKFELKNKKTNNIKYNNNKKEIYLTNFIEDIIKKKETKVRPFNRNINIRLNLNSEIINNNFGNYCVSAKNQNFHKSMSSINLNEKIKEKDKLITNLQTELLQLQEYLSQLQTDKQNELYLTYNTIKNIDNSKSSYTNSLTALLNAPAYLKFNKSNSKIRNKTSKKIKTPFYLLSGLSTTKEGFKAKKNFIRSFSSTSSPRVLLPHKLDNVDSYNNNFSIKSFKRKNNKNIGINFNSNPNILFKKSQQFISPKSYYTRHLSYSNYELANNKAINTNNINTNNQLLVGKCEKLKKRMKKILNKYLLIINELTNKKI